MRIEWPVALLALLLLPLAPAGLAVLERRRARLALRYTNLDVLAAVAAGRRPWRASAPVALALLALGSAVVAISGPERRVPVWAEQVSVALAVDSSGSMASTDVRPTRLGAADQAIRRFLVVLPPRYRVGLVTFSDTPMVASPLTWDRGLLARALLADRPAAGTAIGDSLARSVDLLEPATRSLASVGAEPVAPHAPSAILLLSDGAQTTGRLTPLQGAARARAAGIPVYTVALGTPTGIVHAGVISLRVPPDLSVLRRIAAATGGESFSATTRMRLDDVYEHLATHLGRRVEWRGLGSWFLGLAALCTLAAFLCAARWSERPL